MNELKVIVFKLSKDRAFCLDTSGIKEIIKYEEVKKHKDLPDFFDGTVTLRGDVIPVINLNKRYGYEESQITRKSRIIIEKIKDRQFGLAVDGVTEIKSFSSEVKENTPYVLGKNNYSLIKYVLKTGEDDLLAVIDQNSILSDKECDLVERVINK